MINVFRILSPVKFSDLPLVFFNPDEGKKQNKEITVTKIQKNIDNMFMFNPANDKYSDGTGTTAPKSHTLHQFGDLHLSNQCVQNPNKPEEVFLFATVRRLKPFYYYYCDKWAPWMAFNPEFDKVSKNNYKDKFGQLDNLRDSNGSAIDDQAFLITHNFVEPKQENATVSRTGSHFGSVSNQGGFIRISMAPIRCRGQGPKIPEGIENTRLILGFVFYFYQIRSF